MKCWTIQTVEGWNQAQANGFLKGNPECVWPDCMQSYGWMMGQMKKRIPRYEGGFPVWLWTKRPDLRCNGKLPKGERGVLLEVQLDEDEVLISDFQAWHIVWERIFDYVELRRYEYWSGKEDLQAVAGMIRMEKIKLLTAFTAR
ncbi:DUF3841 domain-containing protein [Paenibacillus sp. 1011MAR3C5]|uniref:DUF3841 domain-containing protein n=1 Tax=Paenibacillus sp. 1011MAR3C5 TaxID=1675787 RepID=UPI000E6D0F4F|nr:DUF3841 domain-containing protein [Paenibacillus sp. 1011MAR3C5]RJE90542.1 DUF3841 domain-containing protein [Paenibacillus sp. 1011MAR3C5]